MSHENYPATHCSIFCLRRTSARGCSRSTGYAAVLQYRPSNKVLWRRAVARLWLQRRQECCPRHSARKPGVSVCFLLPLHQQKHDASWRGHRQQSSHGRSFQGASATWSSRRCRFVPTSKGTCSRWHWGACNITSHSRRTASPPLNSSVMHRPIFLATMWLLSSCTSSHAALPERTTILTPSQAKHALEQCSRETPKSVDGAWAVTPQVVAQLERDLPKLSSLVSHTCCGQGLSVSSPYSFFRQYAGIKIAGRKYVYINAFHDHPIYLRPQDRDLWRSKPMLACDGGEGFWGVLYDPRTHEFSQLSFNGSA